jgi:dTMP kinase
MRGLFVTFEGPEGSGKSTVLRQLAAEMEAAGTPCFSTREPGSGPIGERIRGILLDGLPLPPLTELFLFLADRSQHVETQIKPAIDAGMLVLCDRYADSTLVYQGYGRGMGLDRLARWNEEATGGMKPDITFLLDVPAEIGLRRQTKSDRLDLEPIAFHERVRTGFLTEARREPERWIVVDAVQPLDVVVKECRLALGERLGRTLKPPCGD